MLDRHTLSGRQETAAAFASRVLIPTSTSPRGSSIVMAAVTVVEVVDGW